jgi:hypothetical protein
MKADIHCSPHHHPIEKHSESLHLWQMPAARKPLFRREMKYLLYSEQKHWKQRQRRERELE